MNTKYKKNGKASVVVLMTLLIFAWFAMPGSAVANNTTTAPASVTVSGTISVTLSLNDSASGITFGTVNPGTNNNSAANYLIITIDLATNVATNITQNATGFSGVDTLDLSNLRYSNATGNPGLTSATNMTTSYPAPPFSNWLNVPKPSGSSNVRDVYYWLTIPSTLTAGDYSTNINIKVTQYQ